MLGAAMIKPATVMGGRFWNRIGSQQYTWFERQQPSPYNADYQTSNSSFVPTFVPSEIHKGRQGSYDDLKRICSVKYCGLHVRPYLSLSGWRRYPQLSCSKIKTRCYTYPYLWKGIYHGLQSHLHQISLVQGIRWLFTQFLFAIFLLLWSWQALRI